MELITTLRQQMQLGLSGKINLLSGENGQFIGCIFLVQGFVVGGRYRRLRGRDAVKLMAYHSMPACREWGDQVQLVCEPEVIAPADQMVKWDFNELQVELHRYILEWEGVRSLLPPGHLYLLPRLPQPPQALTVEQFQVLSILVDSSKVEDFLVNCPYTPAKGLGILISLRRLGLIRVAQSV